MKKLILAIAVTLQACGGGGQDSTASAVVAASGSLALTPVPHNGVQLRPCESIGPTAPPCSESQ